MVRSQLAPSLITVQALFAAAEELRLLATAQLQPANRKAMGQFLTPVGVATFMAGMFDPPGVRPVRLLDAGAGSAMLSAAFVARSIMASPAPRAISIMAFESDPGVEFYQDVGLIVSRAA